MKLFICHASEDKDSFVRPLALALKAAHEVWFDEWSLTIGDRLVRKINEGLATCDFAVVVLSPDFFRKGWPQSELDGLFALEETNRKLILPVWKDLDADDVKRFSPILAGRAAAKASEGVSKVTSGIQIAIDASTRTQEISGCETVLEKGIKVSQSIEERDNAARLQHCAEGVALILAAMKSMFDRCLSLASKLDAEPRPLKITAKQTPMPGGSQSDFSVKTNYGQEMDFGLVGVGANYCNAAELRVTLYERGRNRHQPPNEMWEVTFEPTFRLRNQVVWRDQRTKQVFATPGLADHLLDKLFTHIEGKVA
ncbi:MAG TPA: toll/interleukin-1 receptor domain-containing protein [Candidatus Baltobacteraceae bacterium]|jgi:hypothetical protein|nr:toll/interleukin-1 receptor domain-containing protein [Candidatus Baltobacteraceae bacterium]